eukprot:6200484-Pleurochrysis_carterae.AAC.1
MTHWPQHGHARPSCIPNILLLNEEAQRGSHSAATPPELAHALPSCVIRRHATPRCCCWHYGMASPKHIGTSTHEDKS